jgi:hypothetical protein
VGGGRPPPPPPSAPPPSHLVGGQCWRGAAQLAVHNVHIPATGGGMGHIVLMDGGGGIQGGSGYKVAGGNSSAG